MGQAFGQQQQQQQPFGGMGGVPPAALGQPTVNPTNPFNMAAAPPQQIPQQQQQQQLQQLFPGQQQQQQQAQQAPGPSLDLSDEFLGLGGGGGGGGAAKEQEQSQQPERPAELAVGDPFRASTPASLGEQPASAAGGDGFGQGRIRLSSTYICRNQILSHFARAKL